jgi:penicillin amidase
MLRIARRFALALLLAFSLHAVAQQPDPRAEAKAALAQISGTLKLAGLTQPVEVLRDKWGVAHIFAKNQHDLFFAQGFVAAQDRLFQMELWKRVGQGRLAEVIGPAFLERDVNARLLQYRGDMQAEYASYGPDTREILTAFTDGINAFIATAKPSGRLPIEFKYAGFGPEPWKPEDCLTRMAGFPMTNNARAELYHAELVATLGAEKAAQLLDLSPKIPLDPAPEADYTGLKESFLRNLVGSDTRIDFGTGARSQTESSKLVAEPSQHVDPDSPAVITVEARDRFLPDHWPLATDHSSDNWQPATDNLLLEESNNWTISGRLTATGKPILANDPHRAITVPSLRYIVHLVAPAAGGKPTWDVIGAGEPGLPGVAAGHNQRIAWGFTIFPIDQQDLYIEELNPANPLEYKTERGWEKMRVEQQQFRVKGSDPVTRDLTFTRHGPVLWSDGKRALALHWVGAEPGTAGYLASLSVDRAQNWKQYLEAMQRWKVPPENLVYADVEGNIGEQSAGLAPIRNWSGLLPVPGASGKFEWSGFVPLDQLPRQFNPKTGFYATANNKVINDDYKFRIGYSWSAPYRVDRINQVLGETSKQRKLTLQDSAALQSDVTSLAAKEFIDIFHVAASAERAGLNPPVELLWNWTGALPRDSAAAAIYEAVQRKLRPAVAQLLVRPQDNPALQSRIATQLPLSRMLDALNHPTESIFGSSPADKRNQLVRNSLYEALVNTGVKDPAEEQSWRWGKLHTITFRHSLESSLPFANLGPLPRPGDGTTVNATSGTGFTQTSGASYREIFDLSNWDASLAVNTPGQSGQPLSPHYSDLLPLWDASQYFPLAYSREAVEKVATDKLVLQP